MFIRRKELEMALKAHDMRLDQLHRQYWELRHSHERLLKRFGLSEVRVPEQTVLRPTCEKEMVNG